MIEETKIVAYPPISTGLLLTDHQISREAEEVLISSNVWFFLIDQFPDIATSLGKAPLFHIREMNLRLLPSFFDQTADPSDLCEEAGKVIKSMPHLQIVRLTGGACTAKPDVWLPRHHPRRICTVRSWVDIWTENLLLCAIDIIDGNDADLQKVVYSPSPYKHLVTFILLPSYLHVDPILHVSNVIPPHLIIG